MTADGEQLATVMIPGMTEALDAWLARYHELYIERSAPVSDSESHARRFEEAGLMGQAFSIIFHIQTSRRREQIGQPAEPFRPFTPVMRGRGFGTGGAHPFDTPLPHRGDAGQTGTDL